MIVKEGTLWTDSYSNKFRVLHVVTDDENNVWVHYRKELKGYDQREASEYSCYEESFLERFHELPFLVSVAYQVNPDVVLL